MKLVATGRRANGEPISQKTFEADAYEEIQMSQILILLGSTSDLEITNAGVEILKTYSKDFSLRIASAHRTPDFLHSIVKEFNDANGDVCICVAGKSAHLAGVVASLTQKPVLAVPVYSEPTAGLDALLSMSQMPAGIPVATLGFGSSGFTNACLLVLQIVALRDTALAAKLAQYRKDQAQKIQKGDTEHRIDWTAPKK
jgi:5-(carboxyamino)imidazole ribonucleotide mutase